MSTRDPEYLMDMLLEARRIRRFTDGIDLVAFASDEMRRYAVLHSLSVLGEAAKRVSAETKAATPAIQWQAIAGMRNRLIHEYFGVNLDTVLEHSPKFDS
ncbi:MAG: HepT-like ribonuclease domain-containing protein [Gemmatimonadota bacterium]